MDQQKVKNIIEGALLAAGKPLTVNQLEDVFNIEDNPVPSRDQIRKALDEISNDYEGRGIELKKVGSGFRIQVRNELQQWIGRLWAEKAPRYSRALLETLAIIAYRQPVTRGEIEEIRGVSVSTNIVKTMQEREWIRVVGHRDVPGKPAMFGTTREFLDYFNLKSLDELPTLDEIRDLDAYHPELDLEGDQTNESQSDKEVVADVDAKLEATDDETADEEQGAIVENDSATDTEETGATLH